jgi:FAD:protein FMN transferase
MGDEQIIGVDCFGARCTIAAARSERSVGAAIGAARFLLECHSRLSRFLPASELSRLNADRRETVPVSPLMRDFAIAARRAAELSGGLVDPTILPALRRAGYAESMSGAGRASPSLRAAPPARAAARPERAARWREIEIDPIASTITRPPGLELDSGGVAKGWAADRAARMLAASDAYAVECAGDLRVGGTAHLAREVRIAAPRGDGATLAQVCLVSGGVATSGIGKRSWLGPAGEHAHHLIDPGSGEPCFSGVVQATALAPTAEEAEMRAKCAVLAGPDAAAGWLPHGGLIVLDDDSVVDLLPEAIGDAEEIAA